MIIQMVEEHASLGLPEIIAIQALILRGIDQKNAGIFRAISVRIAGSHVKLPDPLKIIELMDQFVAWLQQPFSQPVCHAADAHFKLVMIHPFVDGNGRTARLLMNLLLMRSGYPPALILNERRKAYIDALEKAHSTGIMDDFYIVIADAVERSLDIYLESVTPSS